MNRNIVIWLFFLVIFISSCSEPNLTTQDNDVPNEVEEGNTIPTPTVQDNDVLNEVEDENNAPAPAVQDYDIVYEAEDGNNTLIGVASRGVCQVCSGERHIGYIGNTKGELQFNNINVVETGTK